MPQSARKSCSIGAAALALAAAGATLGVGAPSAMAQAKTAKLLCEGQSFSQEFLAYGDTKLYTPVPGGEFNKEGEGWTLSAGAGIIKAVRPDGSTGGVLSIPVGGKAISSAMCVTLAYPMARAWVTGSGTATTGKGIAVSVSYAGTLSAEAPQEVGKVVGKGSWSLGRFDIAPTLGGTEEAPREVRSIFEGRKGTNELFNVYIDPRMSR